MQTTLFMLLYGNYFSLHRYVLLPLLLQAPERLDVRLWLNVVGADTIDWLLQHVPDSWTLYVSDRNVPKYRAMRYMFNDSKHGIHTPWITWLDDDTLITASDDWLARTSDFIVDNPDVVLFGKEQFRRRSPGVDRWIRNAEWYEGRSVQNVYGADGIRFVQGCYWWLKTSVLRQLDWPDPRLNHNGGDTALSEAIWQQQLVQADFAYGVDGDIADRRGYVEAPAGSTKSVVYRSDSNLVTAAPCNYAKRFAAVGRAYCAVSADTLYPIKMHVKRRKRPIASRYSKHRRSVQTTAAKRGGRKESVQATPRKKRVLAPAQHKLPAYERHDDTKQVTTNYLSRPIVKTPRKPRIHGAVKSAVKKTLKLLLSERQHRKH